MVILANVVTHSEWTKLIIFYFQYKTRERSLIFVWIFYQAFKNHKLHDPLVEPGSADLTADVNFAHIKTIAEQNERVVTFGPIEQREFLNEMGGETRLTKLMESALSTDDANSLKSGYSMLTDPSKMGSRFKFFAMFPKVLENHLRKFPVNGFLARWRINILLTETDSHSNFSCGFYWLTSYWILELMRQEIFGNIEDGLTVLLVLSFPLPWLVAFPLILCSRGINWNIMLQLACLEINLMLGLNWVNIIFSINSLLPWFLFQLQMFK